MSDLRMRSTHRGTIGVSGGFKGVRVGFRFSRRAAVVMLAEEKVSGTDIGHIGRRRPFSFPDTFSTPGLVFRLETVEVFFRLSRGFRLRDGTWTRECAGKHERIRAAVQQAFTSGGAYVTVEWLARILCESVPVTVEEIAALCKKTRQYRVRGTIITRS